MVMTTCMGEASDPEIWVLADDRAGNRAQAIGVAEALQHPFDVKEIRYRSFARLPNVILGSTLATLDEGSRLALTPPWPAMVITAGRRAAPVSRAIKRISARSGDRPVITVQIMDPGSGSDEFDLIVRPCHDDAGPRPNLLTVVGAPHRMSAERLAAGKALWGPRLSALPRPRLAVLVGGGTRGQGLTNAHAEALGRLVSGLAEANNGSLMVTTSRRTGDAETALLASLSGPRHVHRWGATGDNPLTGYLALADAIVVTGDSVSMCCEACATGAPVYIWAPPGFAPAKHVRLHETLIAAGHARRLDEATTLKTWHRSPLNAADDVARAILRLFGSRLGGNAVEVLEAEQQ